MVSGATHHLPKVSDASRSLRVPEDPLERPEDLAKNGGTPAEGGGKRGSLVPHEEEGEGEARKTEGGEGSASLAEGDEGEMLDLGDYDEFEVSHLQRTSRKMSLLDFISTRGRVFKDVVYLVVVYFECLGL